MKNTAMIVLMVLIATASFAEAKGTALKGLRLYRQKCFMCHSDSGENGVHPKMKNRRQWREFFGDKKHPVAIWNDVSDEDWQSVGMYFEHLAADGS